MPEIHLDVRSIDRAKSAVVFFNHFIKYQAEITHISLPYRFIPQKPELNIQVNFDHLYANKGKTKTKIAEEKVKNMLNNVVWRFQNVLPFL